MSKRVTVTLADTVARKLERYACNSGYRLDTVAGIAIELAVKEAEKTAEIPPERQGKSVTYTGGK